MRLATALLVSLIALAPLSAIDSANARTVSANDPLYQSVRRLALVSGSIPPQAVSPISLAELESVLLAIDSDALSPVEQDEYQRVLKLIEATGNSPAAGFGLGIDIEGYLHISDEADEWWHWYPNRRPLLRVPITVNPLPGLTIDVQLDWRKNYPTFPDDLTYQTVNPDPFSNVFSDLRETDVQFPFLALTSAAGDRWSVQFGRSRLSWGSGHTGSLLLSDHAEYHDFLMASLFGKRAGFRALFLDLEPWISEGSSTEPERAFLARRVELQPFNWLSLAANEAMIFHGKPIELRYLNPLVLLHNWFLVNYGNSMINLEVAARPMAGLELWAHLAIDQIQSQIEEERGYPDREPEAFGFLAGVEYVLSVGTGWVTVGTEWVYLNPWMYIGRSILGGFSYRRRVQAENVLPSGAKVIVTKPLGYPLGPDHYGITTYLELNTYPRINSSVEVGLYATGENGVNRDLPAVDESDASRVTPSGVGEFVGLGRITADLLLHTIELGGLRINLSAGGVFDLLRVQNNDHQAGVVLWDFQASPYVSLTANTSPEP